MRPSWDEYFLNIAVAVSKRSTCIRRSVGCVLVDKHHKILATGYNGVASNQAHCNVAKQFMKYPTKHMEEMYPNACIAANKASGDDLDNCQAIHAEQNALLQCPDVTKIHTVYCTVEPCITCTKLLLGTGAKDVIFKENYSKGGSSLWHPCQTDVEQYSWVCIPRF